jgi:hypothetical protein
LERQQFDGSSASREVSTRVARTEEEQAVKEADEPGAATRLTDRRASARGVYGSIIVASVLAATSIDGGGEVPIELTLAVSLVLFWLAHVYSALMALAVSSGKPPRGSEVRHVLVAELPIVESGVVPMLVLAIARGAGVSVESAIFVTLIGVVIELVFFGFVAARRAGLHGMWYLTYAGICGTFGLAIVALEVLIRH